MNRHAIIFSGHMIDDPAREEPRFPANKENAAIVAVSVAVDELVLQGKTLCHGFAGAACGGDIIFHEICQERAIPSTIFLALQPRDFLDHSVRFAGEGWVARFEKLCNSIPVLVLPNNDSRRQLSVWERANEWMVESALSFSSNPCSLVAIWDGKGGDGPGGTKHMVEQLQSLKQKTIVIDPAELSSR